MKYRIFDSDGVFKGGLFKSDVFNWRNCRIWHAPPHPHYHETLIDTSGEDEPCEDSSFFVMRKALGEDGFPRVDNSEEFDPHSHVIAITPLESEMWLTRHGYALPEDLERLLDATDESRRTDERSHHDPMMPARWFKDQYGIEPERLRAAFRRGELRRVQRGSRVFYSVRGAAELWPEEQIEIPAPADPG